VQKHDRLQLADRCLMCTGRGLADGRATRGKMLCLLSDESFATPEQ
jgi:hypothetical protein